MKKIILLFIACMCAVSGYSQFMIKNDGNIFVGDTACYTYRRPGEISIGGIIPQHPQPAPEIMNIKGTVSLVSTGNYFIQGTYVPYPAASLNRCFYINYDGEVYSDVGYITASDKSKKENITPLTSSLQKIKSLRGVTYNYKPAIEESKSLPSAASPKQNDVPKKRIGFIAQEVEKIFPEVVRTLPDSTKGIMYSDLVAVLVEGIKEQSVQMEAMQQQIEVLQQQVELLKNGKSKKQAPQSDNTTKSSKMLQEAVLYQNTPNPFNQETEIAYRIPHDVTASINIYNLNGQELRSYPLTNATGSVIIAASEFTPGIYIYSLIINNQEVDSKRMVLTNR